MKHSLKLTWMRSSCYSAAHVVFGLVWSGWRGRGSSSTAGSCSSSGTLSITRRRSSGQTAPVHAVVRVVKVVCSVMVRRRGTVLGKAGGALERLAPPRLVLVVWIVLLVLQSKTFSFVHEWPLLFLTQHSVKQKKLNILPKTFF